MSSGHQKHPKWVSLWVSQLANCKTWDYYIFLPITVNQYGRLYDKIGIRVAKFTVVIHSIWIRKVHHIGTKICMSMSMHGLLQCIDVAVEQWSKKGTTKHYSYTRFYLILDFRISELPFLFTMVYLNSICKFTLQSVLDKCHRLGARKNVTHITLLPLKVLVPCGKCSWYKIVIMIIWKGKWSKILNPLFLSWKDWHL
jgi:hypothetical protein